MSGSPPSPRVVVGQGRSSRVAARRTTKLSEMRSFSAVVDNAVTLEPRPSPEAAVPDRDNEGMRRPHPALTVASTALLLVLSGCGDEAPGAAEADTGESPSPSATTEKPKPSKSAKPEPEPTPESPTVEVTVSGDQVSPNAEVVELEVGERLTLDITSDRPGELHVHTSPDQYIDFGAGRSTKSFSVERPGSVEVEEHDSGAQVLRLLVQ
jgi:hypothetical protein